MITDDYRKIEIKIISEHLNRSLCVTSSNHYRNFLLFQNDTILLDNRLSIYNILFE